MDLKIRPGYGKVKPLHQKHGETYTTSGKTHGARSYYYGVGGIFRFGNVEACTLVELLVQDLHTTTSFTKWSAFADK